MKCAHLPRFALPLLGLALYAAAPSLFAVSRDVDLKRVTPVPADQPIPMADYFRAPLLHDPRINATGTHVAALISSGEDKYRLLAFELESGKMEAIGGMGDQEVYDFHWLTDSRVMYALSSRKLLGLGYHAADIGSFHRPYTLFQYAARALVSVPRADPSRPLFWAWDFDSGSDLGAVTINSNIKTNVMVNLWHADAIVNDGWAQVKEQNEKVIARIHPLPPGGMGAGYLAERDGELGYAFTHRDGTFTLHRWNGRSWDTCPVDLDDYEIVGVGNRPGELVVLPPTTAGQPRPLHFLDAATGQLGERLLEDPIYDFNGVLHRDPVSRQIVGATYDRHGPTNVWFTDEYRALQSALNALFPKQFVRLLGSDDRGKIFLVRTSSDRQPAVYHWVNLEKKSAGLIKSSRPWIDPARMQPMLPIKYKTRDGLSFDAYLTLPAGASKENPPPLIVMPHGGPWVRDSWGFDAEVQYLASRGYAVLQPNYRGSTGYAWMYPSKDEWDFRKMHDDVTDCARLIARSGHVDPRRIAIMGGSFGGYLALSGVTHETDLYRCAVTMAGVFDWAAMIKDSRYSRFDDPRYARLVKKLGDPAREAEKFAAISPLRHVTNIRVPVFVAHGKDDSVVSVNESRRLVNELEKHDIPHTTHFVREEGHGLANLKNQLALYERIDAFLEANLRPLAP